MKILWMAVAALCLYSIPVFAQTGTGQPIGGQPSIGQPPAPPVVATPAPPVSTPTTAAPGNPLMPTTTVPTANNPTPTIQIPPGRTFADFRNSLLKRTDTRITDLQQRQQCINAATNASALSACPAAETGCRDRDR
jgi:hypothetical protein